MNTRKCSICGEPIAECMGFVFARDILTLLERPKHSVNPIPNVREICGKCGVRALDMSPSEIERLVA